MNAKKTKKKYFSFVLQVGFYVMILTVIPIWSFLSSQRSLNIIYNKHSQLQLANKISEETSVDILGVMMMFITNGTFNISQTPSEQHSIEAVERLTQLKKEVYTGFQNFDGSYDPLVKDILYDGVDCTLYGGIYTNYCVYLNNLGVRTDLISLLSFFTDIISGKLQIFQTMDRSVFLNLLISLYTNANMLGAPTTLLPFEALTINGIVEKQLTSSIADANTKQNTILVIFVVTLIIISVLIWLQILSKMKELNNDFKKVLQVFPPKLILSSFLLKQFINKISRNKF